MTTNQLNINLVKNEALRNDIIRHIWHDEKLSVFRIELNYPWNILGLPRKILDRISSICNASSSLDELDQVLNGIIDLGNTKNHQIKQDLLEKLNGICDRYKVELQGQLSYFPRSLRYIHKIVMSMIFQYTEMRLPRDDLFVFLHNNDQMELIMNYMQGRIPQQKGIRLTTAMKILTFNDSVLKDTGLTKLSKTEIFWPFDKSITPSGGEIYGRHISDHFNWPHYHLYMDQEHLMAALAYNLYRTTSEMKSYREGDTTRQYKRINFGLQVLSDEDNYNETILKLNMALCYDTIYIYTDKGFVNNYNEIINAMDEFYPSDQTYKQKGLKLIPCTEEQLKAMNNLELKVDHDRIWEPAFTKQSRLYPKGQNYLTERVIPYGQRVDDLELNVTVVNNNKYESVPTTRYAVVWSSKIPQLPVICLTSDDEISDETAMEIRESKSLNRIGGLGAIYDAMNQWLSSKTSRHNGTIMSGQYDNTIYGLIEQCVANKNPLSGLVRYDEYKEEVLVDYISINMNEAMRVEWTGYQIALTSFVLEWIAAMLNPTIIGIEPHLTVHDKIRVVILNAEEKIPSLKTLLPNVQVIYKSDLPTTIGNKIEEEVEISHNVSGNIMIVNMYPYLDHEYKELFEGMVKTKGVIWVLIINNTTKGFGENFMILDHPDAGFGIVNSPFSFGIGGFGLIYYVKHPKQDQFPTFVEKQDMVTIVNRLMAYSRYINDIGERMNEDMSDKIIKPGNTIMVEGTAATQNQVCAYIEKYCDGGTYYKKKVGETMMVMGVGKITDKSMAISERSIGYRVREEDKLLQLNEMLDEVSVIIRPISLFEVLSDATRYRILRHIKTYKKDEDYGILDIGCAELNNVFMTKGKYVGVDRRLIKGNALTNVEIYKHEIKMIEEDERDHEMDNVIESVPDKSICVIMNSLGYSTDMSTAYFKKMIINNFKEYLSNGKIDRLYINVPMWEVAMDRPLKSVTLVYHDLEEDEDGNFKELDEETITRYRVGTHEMITPINISTLQFIEDEIDQWGFKMEIIVPSNCDIAKAIQRAGNLVDYKDGSEISAVKAMSSILVISEK